MKKIYSTLAVLMIGLINYSFAQARLAVVPTENAVQQSSALINPTVQAANDTLKPSVLTMSCFTGDATPLVYHTLGAAGYLAGNNTYGETECAQRYNYVTGSVSKVLVRYGKKVGTTGSTTAKIYSLDPTKHSPMTSLGSSAAVTFASITTGTFTPYTFSAPVSVAGGFAAAVVLPTTTGDSIVVTSSKLTCHAADSLSYVNIGGWYTIAYELNGIMPYDTTIELMIYPIATFNNGVHEYSGNGLSLLGAYPNPANDFTAVRYHVNSNTSVAVIVFDLTGRILSQTTETLTPGYHESLIDVRNLPSGNYYYSVKTNEANLTSEFSVVK